MSTVRGDEEEDKLEIEELDRETEEATARTETTEEEKAMKRLAINTEEIELAEYRSPEHH